MKIEVNKMVKMAVLCALSIVLLLFIRFPIIPGASYLEYEPADVPILIGAFLFGPVDGLIMTFVVAFIQAFTVSINSGWVGFVMHLIATGTLVLVAGGIYRKVHNYKGAIIGLIAGVISMTAIMIPVNLFVDTRFYGMTYEAVKSIIVPVLIPFNLIKAGINSVVVVLVYKPIGRFFRAAGYGNFNLGKE